MFIIFLHCRSDLQCILRYLRTSQGIDCACVMLNSKIIYLTNCAGTNQPISQSCTFNFSFRIIYPHLKENAHAIPTFNTGWSVNAGRARRYRCAAGETGSKSVNKWARASHWLPDSDWDQSLDKAALPRGLGEHMQTVNK